MNITLENIVFDTNSLTVNSVTVYILLLTFLVTFAFLKWSNIFTGKHYPNGPWGVPILGHFPFFGRSPPKTFKKWRKQYGDIFTIRLGSWKTVVVNGYDAIKEAVDKPNDDFSSRPPFPSQRLMADRTGEHSLVFGPFDQSYVHKRKLAASVLRHFTHHSRNATEFMIGEEANLMVDSFLSRGTDEPQSIKSDIQYNVVRILFKLLYGRTIQIDQHIDTILDLLNKFNRVASSNPIDILPWLRYIVSWKTTRIMKILGTSDRLRHHFINEHLHTFTRETAIQDVLDALLFAEHKVPNNNSRHATITLLGDLQGAGFDTINKTIQWLTLYMANYPDIQRRVQAEIDYVIGSEHKYVAYEHRERLIYTEATILEVMRISTLVPFAILKYTTRDTKLNGLDIDKDTTVLFNLHSVAHDGVYWTDPDVFQPSRFLTTDETKIDVKQRNRILPFGVGRRRCVGEYLAKMEILIVFTTMMRRCSIIKPDSIEYNFDPIPGIVYSPRDFNVIIRERL